MNVAMGRRRRGWGVRAELGGSYNRFLAPPSVLLRSHLSAGSELGPIVTVGGASQLEVASLPGGAKQDVIPAIGPRVRGNHREQPMQIDESSAGVRLFWLWEEYVRSRNGNRAISLPLLLHPSFPCPSLVLFCSVSLLLCTLFSLLYTRSI